MNTPQPAISAARSSLPRLRSAPLSSKYRLPSFDPLWVVRVRGQREGLVGRQRRRQAVLELHLRRLGVAVGGDGIDARAGGADGGAVAQRVGAAAQGYDLLPARAGEFLDTELGLRLAP